MDDSIVLDTRTAPRQLATLAGVLEFEGNDSGGDEVSVARAHDWDVLEREWSTFWSTIDYRAGHDADPALVRTIWLTCRLLRPQTVVETGVGRGVSTSAILDALERNACGRLVSIDLPPLAEPWFSASAELVPMALRHRWEYPRGSVHRRLPRLLRTLEEKGTVVDLHVADSLHTAAHIQWEVDVVGRFLAPGGVLIVDDVTTWVAVNTHHAGRMVFDHESKGDLFAFIRS
jgi:hypothetical protein